MDNKIKYNLIILFQIKEKDGHIEYVFRLSEKNNPNNFVDFQTRYSTLYKLNENLFTEYKHNDIPLFPEKYIFKTEKNLNERLRKLNDYFNIIFNTDKFYKLNILQKWIKNINQKFIGNEINELQVKNNKIFEKNHNDNDNDTFLDLIIYDIINDENVDNSKPKKYNEMNFNNSNYFLIPNGNDNNFNKLGKNEKIMDYEKFLTKILGFFSYYSNNLKNNYNNYIIKNDFKI